eukprot:1706875-Rhodomonas_salina.2
MPCTTRCSFSHCSTAGLNQYLQWYHHVRSGHRTGARGGRGRGGAPCAIEHQERGKAVDHVGEENSQEVESEEIASRNHEGLSTDSESAAAPSTTQSSLKCIEQARQDLGGQEERGCGNEGENKAKERPRLVVMEPMVLPLHPMCHLPARTRGLVPAAVDAERMKSTHLAKKA